MAAVHPSSTSQNSVTWQDLRKLGSAGDRLVLAAAFEEAARRGLKPDGSRAAALIGPQTDEELLDAVEEITGYHIPRVAVCTEHNHTAPATTFCDLYFERVSDVLWIGNRGGGKTTNSGFLHGAKGRWNASYSSAIAGAVERQGYRAYAEFKRFIRPLGAEVLSTILSKTVWGNGSETEVLGGTVKQLNGPHPFLAQMDEAELTTPEPFQEWLNMAQSSTRYMRQQLLTSTRKRAYGIVQTIVNETRKAEREDTPAPWRIDIFCVFETMARVANCRMADANADTPEDQLCQCHRVRKGEWGDDAPERALKGKPRTFDTVCRGRAHRSDGFVQLPDVLRRFGQLSPSVWNAQQECLSPDAEGIVHKWFKDRHRIPAWMPFPQFGPIYRGWDWGGQNPHAIVWNQKLTVAVGMAWQQTKLPDGSPGWILTPILSDDDDRELVYTIPQGAYVQFDEHYGSADQLGEFSTIGLRAILREIQWSMYGMPMQIAMDFCDPAGYIAKREVRKAVNRLIEEIGSGNYSSETLELMGECGIPRAVLEECEIRVPDFKSIPAPRVESIRKHIELGENDMLYIVLPMCPATDDEYAVYHWMDPQVGKNVPEDAAKEDDHAMDAERYLLWNVERMEEMGQGRTAPVADEIQAPATKHQSLYEPLQTVVRDASIPKQEPDVVSAPGVATPDRGTEFRRHRSTSLPGIR